ncbi:hypothetical protein CLOP_g14775 [Closterium sp. NIES-67]|nr:hypothetical protein CLOP_g14775 [Closterium sp. NIES-67]
MRSSKTFFPTTISAQPHRASQHEEADRVSSRKRTHPTIHFAIRCPSTLHTETGRKPTHVHRLRSSQQADHQEQQHVQYLRRVFDILRRERLSVKLSKSEFALEKVQFLGHMVSAQGVHVDPKKIEAVRMWKTPENVKELQQFLGFANYYNKFVPQYAKIATPLTNLLKKNTPYKCEPKHQAAGTSTHELMSLLGTKLAMSSAYHPQTDGQTDHLNQIVEQLLRAACKDEISKWDFHLPVLEFAYNNATDAATGQTPFFLCYGRHPLMPQKPTAIATQQQNHLPSKLRPHFCGPFLVEVHATPVTFRLRLPTTWKIHNAFHVQLLKPYRDPNTVFTGRQPPPPPHVLVHDEPLYEVESVLAHRRRRNGTVELLIRWKGS